MLGQSPLTSRSLGLWLINAFDSPPVKIPVKCFDNRLDTGWFSRLFIHKLDGRCVNQFAERLQISSCIKSDFYRLDVI